jgi:hypothetical protein
MIALPAILAGKSLPLVAGVLLGALIAWGPASCVGKGQANQATALKNQATAATLQASAARMEMAAALTEMALSARTTADVKELREIVREEATQAAVGNGMQRTLERLRSRAATR